MSISLAARDCATVILLVYFVTLLVRLTLLMADVDESRLMSVLRSMLVTFFIVKLLEIAFLEMRMSSTLILSFLLMMLLVMLILVTRLTLIETCLNRIGLVIVFRTVLINDLVGMLALLDIEMLMLTRLKLSTMIELLTSVMKLNRFVGLLGLMTARLSTERGSLSIGLLLWQALKNGLVTVLTGA